MKRSVRASLVVVLMLMALAGLAGCGLFSSTYEPASYGSADGSQCYYAHNPGEVPNLKQHQKCKDNAKATLAPAHYLYSYYPFLRSSFYRDTYVPASARSDYDVFMTSFGQAHAADIEANAPKAQYVDDNGNKVSGADAGVTSDGTHLSSSNGDSFGDTGGHVGSDPHSSGIGDPGGGFGGGEHGGFGGDAGAGGK